MSLSFVVHAQEEEQQKAFTIELVSTFSHFEQQIKTEIGGVKGELLAADTELGVQLVGTYNVWKFIHAGWYFQYDMGNRENGQFSGFDSSGAAQVLNLQGGSFSEFWTGPILRAQYKLAFLEFGYGLVGTRNDDSRADILNTSSSDQGSFSTDPSIAWMMGIGAQVNLWKSVSLLIKAQYRVRYYNSRDGLELQDQAVHGTQNFASLVGFSYKF